MLNIFVGFEQSNRYIISEHASGFPTMITYTVLSGILSSANEQEEVLGYVAEEPRGFLSMFSRQIFRTHRPFRALVMDSQGSPILWVRCFIIHLFSMYSLTFVTH